MVNMSSKCEWFKHQFITCMHTVVFASSFVQADNGAPNSEGSLTINVHCVWWWQYCSVVVQFNSWCNRKITSQAHEYSTEQTRRMTRPKYQTKSMAPNQTRIFADSYGCIWLILYLLTHNTWYKFFSRTLRWLTSSRRSPRGGKGGSWGWRWWVYASCPPSGGSHRPCRTGQSCSCWVAQAGMEEEEGWD